MNDSKMIQRELDRFCAVIRAMFEAGKISEDVRDRNIDGALEVEDCLPISVYGRIEWTKEAVINLRKIRAFMRRAA